MDTIELSKKLTETTYFITSFFGNDPFNKENNIGTGSGVTINKNGDILTAAHVISGRIPFKPEDISNPNQVILARNHSNDFIQYIPQLFISPFTSSIFRAPICIDLVILQPVNQRTNVNYLPISSSKILVGEKILMAGYPDDMELPLSISKSSLTPEAYKKFNGKQLENASQMLLMIKSGMVGHVKNFTLDDINKKIRFEGTSFFIDNELHSGASGGPVINSLGEVLGIISQRAITSVAYEETPKLKVPSGSTIAISARTILLSPGV